MSRRASLAAALLVVCGSCGDDAPTPVTGGEEGWPVSVELGTPDPELAFERVILVTIDTLRADHVSSYGYFRPTTPFLDSLAERGALFERAVAAVSHTAPSHATMLTGLVPLEHGVLENGTLLPEEAMDLARMFGAAGRPSAAFLSVGFLEGIAGSFDHVRVEKQSSVPLVQAAMQWLSNERTSERFFLWLHMYDPHRWRFVDRAPRAQLEAIRRGTERDDDALYDALEELHGLPRLAPDEPFALPWTVTIRGEVELETRTRRDYLDFIDTYDAQIRLSDDLLRALYEHVEGLGLGGRTLWVVTSDHGEGLASHGAAGHGSWIYQEQLLVPLVVHASDGAIPARRIPNLVQHVDLFPTLAATLGARVHGLEPGLHGQSLWPLLRAGAGDWIDRPAFSQRKEMPLDGPAEAMADAPHNAGELFSLQSDRHKYLLRELGPDEFFDLELDPLELEDRSAEASTEASALRALLEARIEIYRARGAGAEPAPVSAEWAEELRKLGYAN